MLVLAIDTATTDLVTGLVDTATGDHRDWVIPGVRGHNENLVPAIEKLFADTSRSFADLDAVVVGQGPGPFTQLRIGMATAQAIAQALRIPVYGITTHDAIAARIPQSRVLVATDARRKEVYWATYTDGRRTAGPDVVKPAELQLPHEVDIVSSPIDIDIDAPRLNLTPRALHMVRLVDFSVEPAPLTPQYLRRPDAKVPTPKPKSPAIPDVEL